MLPRETRAARRLLTSTLGWRVNVGFWRFRDPKWPPPLVTQSGGSIWPHLVPSFWVGFSSDFGIGDLASGFERDSLA